MSTPILLSESSSEPPAWDERRMRRSVRRTLLRTAVNAALLLVAGALALQLVAGLLVDPLLIDRGDRVPAAVTATIDVPVMTIPGAEISEVRSHMGTVRRITEVDVVRAVGAYTKPLGTFGTRLGAVRIGTTDGAPVDSFGPMLQGPDAVNVWHQVPFDPARLGEGTAVTVELVWQEGMTVEEADAIHAGIADVALLWVGFRVPGGDHPMDRSWRLGYSACGEAPELVTEQRRGGFGTTGFRVFGDDTGARHALEQVRRATANLAATGLVDEGQPGALADTATAAAVLADAEPEVTSVVVSGPTQAVAEVVDATAPTDTDLLEVDFDRGTGSCG